MPAPTTAAEVLDLVQKSGIVEGPRLSDYVDRLRLNGPLPAEPKRVAGQLVRDALITVFQAEQILQGKWKRFIIGKYKVLERLGSGGMGQVYLCEHVRMRTKVAVKVLPTAKAKDASSLDRFKREARAAGLLNHPNLVRAFDIDEESNGQDSIHYLVMEYVDGANIQEIVKRSGPLDPIRACQYIYRASLGLQYAYEVAELVHRDVKPGNIMVDRQGNVKLLDMGLARFFNDETDILTKKYDETVLGTADYLAPEQARDSHDVDVRADIYSLGATFYFMLTGHPPFPEGSVAQKLIWHQTRQPKPVRLERPEVPEGVAKIMERMMMKDSAARYQTPAELAGALAPFVRSPIAPPTEAEVPRLCPAATSPVAAETIANAHATVPLPQAVPATVATGVAVAERDSVSRPSGPSAFVPPRSEQANPFAHLLGQAANRLSVPDLNLPASAEAAMVATPAEASTSKLPTPRGRRAAFAGAGVAVLAAVVYMVWRFTLAPPGG
jgi:serine/threonine protein kinase